MLAFVKRPVSRIWAHVLPAAAKQPEGNPIVRAGVSGLTALLEALGIGRRAQDAQEPVRRLDRVQPGDIAAIMDRIRTDYEEHAYFVTGDIWEGIYADDCFFGDPTVSFTGLQKWRKNLQLLVPFLIDPGIELFSLSELDALASSNNSAQKLKADWRLTAYLKLPWKPFIDINGSTEYTLDPMNQQVVRHIESWSVSGTEAILQILKPSPGPRRRPEE
ncbi:g12592 [Coccomyxa viridis]|uniref:G12592 protein n=1 Tax=Coccomyxa viridis TaxID=1274662 RepID=A0ABP1GAQ1_9CHLO